MITPSTTIKFLKVPFSSSQNSVLKFASVAAQLVYMNAKVVHTITGCTYQREGDGEFIRTNKSKDELYICNYVMFQNYNFGDRWFYAFIEHIEYVGNKVCKVFLNMDSFQTFQFDYTLQKSFIDRQTFGTDYYNTLSDTPSVGDLKTVFEYQKPLVGKYFTLFNSDPTIADSSLSGLSFPSIGDHSIPCYMAFSDNAGEMSELVLAVGNKGRADRIQACYFAPVAYGDTGISVQMLPRGDLTITAEYIKTIYNLNLDKLFEDFTVAIPYTPTFKKEISYPYAKLEIVDKITATHIELDISKFADPLNPQFRIMYNFTGGCDYKVVPLNYNGISYSIENALSVNPNTDLPIFSNSYSKYLKANQDSNALNLAMSVGSGIAAGAMGNVGGAMSAFGSIANIVNADNQARQQPNQVSGIKGDGMEYVNFTPCIYFRLKVMDTDHVDIARNFWSSYGYPIRKVTNPVNDSTRKFNFIKTADCNIIADTIPTEYQRELEQMYNKGVTIWNYDYLNY